TRRAHADQAYVTSVRAVSRARAGRRAGASARLARPPPAAALPQRIHRPLRDRILRLCAHLPNCAGGGLRQAQDRTLLVALQRDLAALNRMQLPALIFFPDLQAQRRLGGLVDKDRKALIV